LPMSLVFVALESSSHGMVSNDMDSIKHS